jgi:hypothetical protein
MHAQARGEGRGAEAAKARVLFGDSRQLSGLPQTGFARVMDNIDVSH